MAIKKTKPTSKSQPKRVAKKLWAKTATKSPSVTEISNSWTSFKPIIPLSYIVAARKAAREKNT